MGWKKLFGPSISKSIPASSPKKNIAYEARLRLTTGSVMGAGRALGVADVDQLGATCNFLCFD